jgi:hypothetical protein
VKGDALEESVVVEVDVVRQEEERQLGLQGSRGSKKVKL